MLSASHWLPIRSASRLFAVRKRPPCGSQTVRSAPVNAPFAMPGCQVFAAKRQSSLPKGRSFRLLFVILPDGNHTDNGKDSNGMKRKLLWTALLSCLLACAGCDSQNSASAGNGGGNGGKRGIVILHENDVHCKYGQGYAAMDRMRSAIGDTAWVAVVSSGDYIQGAAAGAVSRGQYILDILRPMKYDAIGLGNHEFDYSIAVMRNLLGWGNGAGQGGRMPVTCANFIDTDADTLMFPPYVMRQYGEKRVAFVGVLTAATHEGEPAAFKTEQGDALPYCVTDGARLMDMVQNAVDEARREGADHVIVLSHLGNDSTLSYTTSQALVAATRGIDAVLDGHTHAVYTNRYSNLDGKLVPVTQTGSMFANIGKLYIAPDGGITSVLVPLDSAAQWGGEATAAVTEAVAGVDKNMDDLEKDIIAATDFALYAKHPDGRWMVRCEETNLGDLVADAFRAYTGADVAVCIGGEIRDGLDLGAISRRDAINVLPFFDTMFVISATGAAIKEALDSYNFNVPAMSGSFTQVSGMKYTIVKGTPSTVTDIQILNATTGLYEPIDPQRHYTLATSKYAVNDYVYGKPLKGSPVVRDYSSLNADADMLIWYLKTRLNGTVPEEYRTAQGRITIR